MKKFLTIMLVLITAMGLCFAANPGEGTKSASAEATFVFTLNYDNLLKTKAGFFSEAVNTYDNLIKEVGGPAAITGDQVYGTDFGGASGKTIYAVAGTNWANAEAASASAATAPLTVTLTMTPFKQTNAEVYRGYSVEYNTLQYITAGNTPKLTIKTDGGAAPGSSNETAGTITVGRMGTISENPTLATDKVTISGPLGAFVTSASDPSTHGYLEIAFTNMKVQEAEATPSPTYAPTVGAGAAKIEEQYKTTWTFLVKAQ